MTEHQPVAVSTRAHACHRERDEISELVDWQLANRPASEVITQVCRVCLTGWTGEATTCPDLVDWQLETGGGW